MSTLSIQTIEHSARPARRRTKLSVRWATAGANLTPIGIAVGAYAVPSTLAAKRRPTSGQTLNWLKKPTPSRVAATLQPALKRASMLLATSGSPHGPEELAALREMGWQMRRTEVLSLFQTGKRDARPV